MNKPAIFVILIFTACLNLCSQDKYNIHIHCTGGENQEVILGHYLGSSMVPLDTIQLDNKGDGVFSGEENLLHGLYFVYLGYDRFIDIIITEDQCFNVSMQLNGPDISVEGSTNNKLFFDYRAYMLLKGAEMGRLQDLKIRSTSKAAKDSIDLVIQKLNTEVEGQITSMIEDNKGTFFSTFVAAARDVKIPAPPKDSNGNLEDSLFFYHYYNQHYFDHFDLRDERLLRTPIYNEKVEYYITRVVAPVADSLLKAVDFLIARTEKNEELFKNMLSTLMLYSMRNDNAEMEEVFVHLAEDYYIPKATWATQEFMDLLKKKTTEKKRIMCGQVAPDFEFLEVSTTHFLASARDSIQKADTLVGEPLRIHSIDAEYTVLYFWEADCGHCKEVTPKLFDMYRRNLKSKGVKVLCIQMLTGPEGKAKWVNFINKHQLYDWYNVWQPVEFEYRMVYDLRYSPEIYLLDKDKKIIAKHIAPEQVEEIIELHKAKKL